ncbi:hypothetical protein OROGR_001150 [Orobanche gracilis]
MAGEVPLEVGARGTIGSLLKREIEYFRKIDMEHMESFERESDEMAPGRRNSSRCLRLPMLSWRRKNKRRNNVIRPGICSMVEVANSQVMNEISGFRYLNLGAESMRFKVE